MIKVNKNVFLDIDGCIATAIPSYELKSELDQYLRMFQDRGLYIEVEVEVEKGKLSKFPHIIHPGAIELITALLNIPEVDLSFFSNAIEERNVKLVHKLKEKMDTTIVGIDKLNRIEVFSRKDTVLAEHLPERQPENDKYDICFYGNRKKDLKKILLEKLLRTKGDKKFSTCSEQEQQEIKKDMKEDVAIQLKNSILVDDDWSFAHRGQVPNLLKVHEPSQGDFYRGFDTISTDKDFINEPHFFDVFTKTNNIFYATGLLWEVFALAKKSNTSLNEALFQLQFKPDPKRQGRFKYRFDLEYFRDSSIESKMQFFEKGLKVLQEYNPNIKFYSPESCKHYL